MTHGATARFPPSLVRQRFRSGLSARLIPSGIGGITTTPRPGCTICKAGTINPKWGRFLNADGYVSTGTGLLGYNMYAYCDNNPVMGYDPTGEWNWGTFLSGANLIMVGAMAMATAATILSCGAAAPLMVVVAAATAVAGAATVVNGIAEVVEAGTDYNFVRDGTFGGDEEAYNTYKAVTQTVAEIGTTICGAYNVANGGNICFVAGTLVLTATGHEAIERIEAGDWVWATDPETGETELKQVVQTFWNETKELVHITVNGEEIVCTPTHPFYVPQKGWTEAIQLRAGDRLQLLNGEYIVVEQVQHELLESPETTYNFEVEDFHTYYVGEEPVLVHNSCRGNAVKKAWKAEAENVKNGGTGITRLWSPDEQAQLLSKGKVSGYVGHHMKSVSGYPDLAGNANNIQFLTWAEHFRAHSFNWRTVTHGFFEYWK